MSDSVKFTVPSDDWVDISNSATDGLITNEGHRRVKIYEDATKPTDADLGHSLNEGDYIRYSLAGSQLVWARAFGDQDGLVVVTSE